MLVQTYPFSKLYQQGRGKTANFLICNLKDKMSLWIKLVTSLNIFPLSMRYIVFHKLTALMIIGVNGILNHFKLLKKIRHGDKLVSCPTYFCFMF